MDKNEFEEYMKRIEQQSMAEALLCNSNCEQQKGEYGDGSLLELYRSAVAKWGKQLQIDRAIEEMAELTAALVRDGMGRQANVAEEIADVRIMLEQLEVIFDVAGEVADFRQKKLARLAGRVQ